jgi:undecaprenyl-diphosphatase
MDWTQLWHGLLQWVALHPVAAYFGIFLVSLSESLALVGLLIPGTVIMIGIGALVGSGALSLTMTLFAAMLGAVSGDGISYWLGRHYHQGIKALWPFRNYPTILSRGEIFFQRHGGKSVLFGRFFGPVRAVVPLIAGMLDMPVGRFVLVNIFSAIGWAFAYIIPGVVLGSSLTLVSEVSVRLSLLILLLGLLLWLTLWLCRTIFSWLGRLELKGEKLMFRLCLSLFLSSWLFLGVLEDLLSLDPLVAADQAIYRFLQSLRTPWGDHILVAVTELGDGLVNVSVAVAVLLTLVLHRQFRAAGYWVFALAGGAGIVQLIKWGVHRPRPISIYQGVSGWGFPSGHTAMSVILYGFLAVLLIHSFSKRWNWIPFAAAIGLSLLIAFSRLYLGAHWLSDVLGGFSLGWAWTTFLAIFYLRHRAERPPVKMLPIVTLLTILIAGGWHIQSRHSHDLSRYQVQKQVQFLTGRDWIETEWQRLPGWRIDLTGEVEQPLSFQWAGDPEQLATLLSLQGWSRGFGSDFKALLTLFTPHPRIEQLSLLPRLNNGQQERLLMWELHDGERLVLRLWPTNYRLLNHADQSLWVGSVESEQTLSMVGFLNLSRGVKDFASGLQRLQQALPATALLKTVQRPKAGGVLDRNWGGETLLLTGSGE